MRYLCDPHVIPTVVPGSFDEIISYAKKCAEFTNALHVDVADGMFAPNTTWPLAAAGQIEELSKFHSLELPSPMKFEAHLMVNDVRELGAKFVRAGFTTVIGHIEAFNDAGEALQALVAWKQAGLPEAGIAIKLDTPLEALDGVVAQCDLVHLMSIADIGYQGRPFDEQAFTRVEELHAQYPDLLVSVDGGVTEATVEALARAGANRMTVGAAISRSPDAAAAFASISERAMRGCIPQAEESIR